MRHGVQRVRLRGSLLVTSSRCVGTDCC